MSKLYIKNKYGQIPNEVLNNKNISLKAKGLFGYLQSKPDGWKFSVKLISGQMLEQEKSISSGLKELELSGYLKRKNYQDAKGRWTTDYYLYEEPYLPQGVSVNRLSADTDTAQRYDISKKEESKKEEVINNIYGRFEDFWNVYPKKTGKKVCQSLWERKKLDRVADDIVAFIAKAKQTDRWQRGFIKNAETFLRQEAWNDDIAAYGATTTVSVYQEPTDLVAKLKAKNNLK